MKSQEMGFSIISAMVGAAIVAIVGMAATKLIATTLKSGQRSKANTELEMIKRSIVEQLDCSATLNATSPISCNARPGTLVLKRSNGTSLTNSDSQIGAWTVEGRCMENEVVITATRPGKDPLSKRLYSTLPEAEDLFRGTSELCRNLLDSSFQQKYVYVERAGMVRDPVDPSNHCQMSSGFTHPFLVGSVECPRGYRILSGGTFCAHGIVAQNIPDVRKWTGACCSFPGYQGSARGTSKVFARCVRDGDYY